MPLPETGLPWPPAQLAPLRPAMDAWSAWYSGDATALGDAYAMQSNGPNVSNRPSQFRGGLVGAVARTFWGAPQLNGDGISPSKLHVPIAADICQASADLLFAEPPTLTVDDPATQERLTEMVGDGMLTTLAEAAEVGAALGGVYLRVTWDTPVTDTPFLTVVHADAAWPEFRWSKLTAVTFWHVVAVEGSRIWRHLERHETAANGNGVIVHGLYEGTFTDLGRPVPFTDQPATADLAANPNLVDGNTIDTGSPGLAVVYVPNQRPQRRWRRDPLGVNLGRSDLDGIEGLMDQLDEVYSSWMRDIRLGKARVFVSETLLQDLGPGKGTAFDADTEIFAPVAALAGGRDQPLSNQIQAEQFAIRYAEHQATAQQLVENILRGAGYSAATFGEGTDGAAMTATEITARQQRSFLTRDRKIRLWRPALAEAVEKLLAVDLFVFGTAGVRPQRPDVVFADGVQDSPLNLAQTAQALKTAGAASTKTLVQLVHPDWDDDQLTAEVDLILAESGQAVPDPFPSEGAGEAFTAVGSNGADQPDAG